MRADDVLHLLLPLDTQTLHLPRILPSSLHLRHKQNGNGK